MSVHYHAYQNRGYLLADHEADAEIWYRQFSGYDPSRISGILNLAADREFLYIPYFGKEYRLCLENGHLQKKTGEDTWSEDIYFNEGMAIYHLLSYTKDTPLHAGVWVQSESLYGVVSRRDPGGEDPLTGRFSRMFDGRAEQLSKACREAGGVRQQQGDLCFDFAMFPFLTLRLVFWDGDDEFPAQTNILVDKCVTDYIYYGTIGCLISDLLERIEEAAQLSDSVDD